VPATGSGLNILYVGTLPPHPGGSAILASHLLGGLTKLGNSVRALAPITAEALQGGDRFALSHPSIAVRRFLVPRFETAPNIAPLDDYRALERAQIQELLPILIGDGRPDIIIIGRETFAWHVPDLARAHSLPCILLIQGGTTHGILMRTFPAVEAQQLLEQFRKANCVVAVAEHLAESLRPLGVNRIKVIPNPVDMHRFSPGLKDGALRRELAIPEDNIVILHVSNLKPVKRPLDLVSSAERALQENSKLVYVIVGDGPCREIMEEACKKKLISASFKFVGWVDHDRVADYINLGDMVVMPSEAEGQALVYLETQACARLLMASDIPAAREVIVDAETGLLFRKGNIEDLTAKTLLVAGEPKLRAAIGRKARQQVKAHALNNVVATYAFVLAEVVQELRG